MTLLRHTLSWESCVHNVMYFVTICSSELASHPSFLMASLSFFFQTPPSSACITIFFASLRIPQSLTSVLVRAHSFTHVSTHSAFFVSLPSSFQHPYANPLFYTPIQVLSDISFTLQFTHLYSVL